MSDFRAAADEVRDHCFSWLVSNADGFLWPPTATLRSARLKAFGELLAILTACTAHGPLTEDAKRLVAFAAAALADLDWDSQLIRDPRFIVAVLTVADFLEVMQFDATHMRTLARRGLEAGIPADLDVVPYRKLEIEYLARRVHLGDAREALFARALRGSMSALDKPLALFTVRDTYALAHVALFVCDHGRREASTVVSRGVVTRLRWLMQAAMNVAALDDDFDLLAELLLADTVLGEPDTRLAHVSVLLARAARLQAGTMPTTASSRGDAFLDAYHPTLMWAYAGAALSSTSRRADAARR